MNKELFTIFVVITVLVIGGSLVFFAKNKAFFVIPVVNFQLPQPASVEAPSPLSEAAISATSSGSEISTSTPGY